MLKKMSAKRLVAVILSLICLCSISTVAFASTPPLDEKRAIVPMSASSYRLNTSANPQNRSNVNIWANTGNRSQRWRYVENHETGVNAIVSEENMSLALNINHSNNNCEMLNPRDNVPEDFGIIFANESAQGGAECYRIVMKAHMMVLELTNGTPSNGLNVYWAQPGQVGQQDRQLWYVWSS